MNTVTLPAICDRAAGEATNLLQPVGATIYQRIEG